MESALRAASVVLVIVTTDFLRSKHCLEELHWACDQMQRQSQQAQQGQQSAGALVLVPIFYHDQDPTIGLGVDSFQRGTIRKLLQQHHAAASTAQRTRWLDALMLLPKRAGIRQDSTRKCVRRFARIEAGSSGTAYVCCLFTKFLQDVKMYRRCNPEHLSSDSNLTREWRCCCRGDDALVSEIATHLLRTLPPPAEDEREQLMGITEQVQQLQEVITGQDVGTVGLYGMGGSGKTTLAKAFFSEQSKMPIFQRRVLLHVGHDAKDGILQDR
jgi:hypothetical protein